MAELSHTLQELFPDEEDRQVTAVGMALTGLQFKRFILGEGIEDPEQTPEKYSVALETLITKFGDEVFLEACKRQFDNNITSLDLHTSVSGRQSKDSPGHAIHSDLQPVPSEYMVLAQELTDGQYPIHMVMRDYGSIVNERPLFGDPDFWRFVFEKHPKIADALIAHMRQWPEEMTSGNMYVHLTLSPQGAVAKYFPEATAEIRQRCPDFASTHPKAILRAYTAESMRSLARLMGGRKGNERPSDEQLEQDQKNRYLLERNRFCNAVAFRFNATYSHHHSQSEHGDVQKKMSLDELLKTRLEMPSDHVLPAITSVVDALIAQLDPLELETFLVLLRKIDTRDLAIEYVPGVDAFDALAVRVAAAVRTKLMQIIAKIPYQRVL